MSDDITENARLERLREEVRGMRRDIEKMALNVENRTKEIIDQIREGREEVGAVDARVQQLEQWRSGIHGQDYPRRLAGMAEKISKLDAKVEENSKRLYAVGVVAAIIGAAIGWAVKFAGG